MSIFNPDTFLGATTTEALDTKVPRVPDGIWKGQVKSLNFRTLEASADKGERTIMEVTWSILDESVKKETGLPEPTVRQTIWLDLDAQGKLAAGAGKNVSIGRLREALGQNKPGKPWAPAHLVGGMAKVSVKSTVNKRDGETYSEVDKVAKA
jgi:hypothetical protein